MLRAAVRMAAPIFLVGLRSRFSIHSQVALTGVWSQAWASEWLALLRYLLGRYEGGAGDGLGADGAGSHRFGGMTIAVNPIADELLAGT